eukprot:TRINITY_DN1028_c0_g1_i1.p1 TRINITY_DN1028_c0_g1~~TRINITY_DN1028_c0_g1_i1.p1  ORF type:complete len:204 (+),score=38.60 TRINITY_DN1028_c0_g1_i1:135-746(+)
MPPSAPEGTTVSNTTLLAVNVGCHQMRFLILNAPTPSNLSVYIKELKRNGVQSLVRVCAPTYKEDLVVAHGIKLFDSAGWFFEDGTPPPKEVLQNWLNLLEKEFDFEKEKKEKKPDLTPQGPLEAPEPDVESRTVGVHCIAGLGRAPVLVAVALIELAKMQAADAVTYIRKHRPGCFNKSQLKWLLNYKRTRTKEGSGCCSVQ